MLVLTHGHPIRLDGTEIDTDDFSRRIEVASINCPYSSASADVKYLVWLPELRDRYVATENEPKDVML
jgi:hypothetical protein